jgi:hypothetical protein
LSNPFIADEDSEEVLTLTQLQDTQEERPKTLLDLIPEDDLSDEGPTPAQQPERQILKRNTRSRCKENAEEEKVNDYLQFPAFQENLDAFVVDDEKEDEGLVGYSDDSYDEKEEEEEEEKEEQEDLLSGFRSENYKSPTAEKEKKERENAFSRLKKARQKSR